MSTVAVGFLHPGTYAAVFAESKTGLILHDTFGKQRIVGHPHGQMGKHCGAGGIVDGRNTLAAAVLEHGVDWLFMVDSDMGFDADIVDRLLHVANPDLKPIVGGLAFAHKTDGEASFGGIRYRPCPTVYRFHEETDRVGFVPWFDYPRNKVVNVAATGAACVLIHRSVFAKIEDKFGPVWFDTIRHPKGAHFSEDLAFCVRAAACDIPIHVHTGVKTVHDKGGVCWDEEAFDRYQAAKREAVA